MHLLGFSILAAVVFDLVLTQNSSATTPGASLTPPKPLAHSGFINFCTEGNFYTQQTQIVADVIAVDTTFNLPTCKTPFLEVTWKDWPYLSAFCSGDKTDLSAAQNSVMSDAEESCQRTYIRVTTVVYESETIMEVNDLGFRVPRTIPASNCTVPAFLIPWQMITDLQIDAMKAFLDCDAEREKAIGAMLNLNSGKGYGYYTSNRDEIIPSLGISYNTLYSQKWADRQTDHYGENTFEQGACHDISTRYNTICPTTPEDNWQSKENWTPTASNDGKCVGMLDIMSQELSEFAIRQAAYLAELKQSYTIAKHAYRLLTNQNWPSLINYVTNVVGLDILPHKFDVTVIDKVQNISFTLNRGPNVTSLPCFWCNVFWQGSYSFTMKANVTYYIRDLGYIIKPIHTGNTSIEQLNSTHFLLSKVSPRCQAEPQSLSTISNLVTHHSIVEADSSPALGLDVRPVFRRPISDFAAPEDYPDLAAMSRFNNSEIEALRQLLSLRSGATLNAAALNSWQYFMGVTAAEAWENPFVMHDLENATKFITKHLPDLADAYGASHSIIECVTGTSPQRIKINISEIHDLRQYIVKHCEYDAAEIYDYSTTPPTLIANVDDDGVHSVGTISSLVTSATNTFHHFNLAGRSHKIKFNDRSRAWQRETGLILADQTNFEHCMGNPAATNCTWNDIEDQTHDQVQAHRTEMTFLQQRYNRLIRTRAITEGLTTGELSAATQLLKHSRELQDASDIAAVEATHYGKHGKALAAAFSHDVTMASAAAKRFSHHGAPRPAGFLNGNSFSLALTGPNISPQIGGSRDHIVAGGDVSTKSSLANLEGTADLSGAGLDIVGLLLPALAVAFSVCVAAVSFYFHRNQMMEMLSKCIPGLAFFSYVPTSEALSPHQDQVNHTIALGVGIGVGSLVMILFCLGVSAGVLYCYCKTPNCASKMRDCNPCRKKTRKRIASAIHSTINTRDDLLELLTPKSDEPCSCSVVGISGKDDADLKAACTSRACQIQAIKYATGNQPSTNTTAGIENNVKYEMFFDGSGNSELTRQYRLRMGRVLGRNVPAVLILIRSFVTNFDDFDVTQLVSYGPFADLMEDVDVSKTKDAKSFQLFRIELHDPANPQQRVDVPVNWNVGPSSSKLTEINVRSTIPTPDTQIYMPTIGNR
jgi:hypothetical protein